MTKNILNFFDGEISKSDIGNALTRIIVIVVSLLIVMFVLSLFQSNSASIDAKMNPLYKILQDNSISDSAKALAMDKLTLLNAQKSATSFWQILMHTTIMLFFFTLVSSLCAFAFTKWRWSNDTRLDSPGLKEYADIQKEKLTVLRTIFATVFVAGAIIYLADKI